VPQLWWCPILVAVAALFTTGPALRWGGFAVVAILSVNLAMVGLSAAAQDVHKTLQVRRQNAQIARAEGQVCLFTSYAFAREAMLASVRPKIRFSETPLVGCSTTPLAATRPDMKAAYCTCGR
jgi:hypothetical protein